MKVLAVIGSPRKNGNCRTAVDIIVERLSQNHAVELDLMFISELDLGFCRGCCACIMRGERFCPKKEKVNAVLERMEACHCLILSSPVYAHQVTALMKSFVDHLSFLFHRPRFFKPAIVLATTDGSGLKETLGYLRFTAIGWGFYVADSLGLISPALELSEVYRGMFMKSMERAARRAERMMESGRRPSPGFYELMFFRGMRSKTLFNPCDKAYWQERGWFESDYYVEVPLNPVLTFLANRVEGISSLTTKSMLKRFLPNEDPQAAVAKLYGLRKE